MLLPQAKSGARPVILSDAAREIIAAQLEKHPVSDWVFPGPGGRPAGSRSARYSDVLRAAGLKDFHFHDLRHHGATMALNTGVHRADRDGARRLED